MDDGPGQGQPLLLAPGEHPRRFVGECAQFLPLQQLPRPRAHDVPVEPVEPAHHLQDLPGGQRVPDAQGVRHPARVAPHRARVLNGVGARDPDGAGVGPQQGGEHQHQGGLARTVGPHQRRDRAGRGHQVHPLQRLHRSEAARHAGGGDARRRQVGASPGCRRRSGLVGAAGCRHAPIVRYARPGGKETGRTIPDEPARCWRAPRPTAWFTGGTAGPRARRLRRSRPKARTRCGPHPPKEPHEPDRAEVRGSSVADAEGIKRVAKRIVETKKTGHQVVVVVSAMGDTTDELIDLAEQVSRIPPAREFDMLLTAGERISMALLAMAIKTSATRRSRSPVSQAGMITDSAHGKARIIDVTPGRIRSALDEGNIAIVAGFQGVSAGQKDITTLGRGGSDTTAVALAAALERRRLRDLHRRRRRLHRRPARRAEGPEDRLDLLRGHAGAGQLRVQGACTAAWSTRAATTSRSTSVVVLRPPGHLGRAQPDDISTRRKRGMEQAIISGVAHDTSEAKITVVGVPGQARRGRRDLPRHRGRRGQHRHDRAERLRGRDRPDRHLLHPAQDRGPQAIDALERARRTIGFDSLRYDDQIGKISLVGAGMKTNPGVTATFFEALSEAGVNIELISTSEIRISVVTREDMLDPPSAPCTPPSVSTPTKRPWSTGAPAAEQPDRRERTPHQRLTATGR